MVELTLLNLGGVWQGRWGCGGRGEGEGAWKLGRFGWSKCKSAQHHHSRVSVSHAYRIAVVKMTMVSSAPRYSGKTYTSPCCVGLCALCGRWTWSDGGAAWRNAARTRGNAWCNSQHVCFPSLPPMLPRWFESCWGLEPSGCSMWHFLKLIARVFLRVLWFPPLLHRFNGSANKIKLK